jgi:hypothetical protein
MGYLSVHEPRVGSGPTARMAAFNDGKGWNLRLVAIYCHKGTKRTQLETAQRRITVSCVGITGTTSKTVKKKNNG